MTTVPKNSARMETSKGSKRKVEETEDSEDTDNELPSDMQVEGVY